MLAERNAQIFGIKKVRYIALTNPTKSAIVLEASKVYSEILTLVFSLASLKGH